MNDKKMVWINIYFRCQISLFLFSYNEIRQRSHKLSTAHTAKDKIPINTVSVLFQSHSMLFCYVTIHKTLKRMLRNFIAMMAQLLESMQSSLRISYVTGYPLYKESKGGKIVGLMGCFKWMEIKDAGPMWRVISRVTF